MKKTLIWILVSSAEAALLYFAIKDVQWCWNLLRFWLWFLLVMTFATSIGAAKKNKAVLKSTRSVPGWVSATYDVGIAAALAAKGNFVYAAIVLIQQLMESATYSMVEEAKKKEAQ